MSRQTFRAILVLAMFIYGAMLSAPLFDHYLTEEEQDILSWLGYGAAIRMSHPLLWAYAAIWFVAIFGMLGFFRWARVLFTVWLCMSAILAAFVGMDVRTAPEAFLLNISTTVDGVILALVYFSTLRNEFHA